MNPSHEKFLKAITGEYPAQVESMSQYKEIRPPVSEEYLRNLCGEDPELISLFDEMIEYFYRYTRDVCAQEAIKHEGITENNEEIQRLDGPRTILHNTMIDSVKIFARNLNKKGKDSTWIGPIDKKGRAGYAQLALLSTIAAISAQAEVKPNQ